ncbi:hypothetical protein E2C01_033587 [Portunus trituberculatus]|uniref:Uncharacterized protein n=1 Tax=Portunus trituberculatus TaxID=210409 RepID=A0A5B7EZ18_PORTR|nr:hypothetical protein [Portunus trituberculatus]
MLNGGGRASTSRDWRDAYQHQDTKLNQRGNTEFCVKCCTGWRWRARGTEHLTSAWFLPASRSSVASPSFAAGIDSRGGA